MLISSLHHGNIDYLWLQAQVQWKAKDFPQYAGVKADGTTCVPTDVIPKYDITLEQAVELQKLCVDYAKPVFLAKDDTDVTVVPQSIPDASAASEGVSSEVVSEQPSPRTNAPRGNTRALEVPSSTSVAVARSIVAEQNLKTASAAGKPKRTKTVRPIPSTTTSVTRSVPTHLSDRRLRGKEPKKFDARPSRARGYSPQGTTTTTTTTTCTSSTTTTTTTCTLWELEASSTPTVRSYDEQDSTDSYGFIKGEMGHGRGISDRDRKPHPRRRPRRFNNEPAYAVADGTIFMAAAKGEKSKKGSKAKKSKGSKGNNILIPGSSKGASYAIDDADEDDKPEYVKPPTQGNATKVRNRRFSPDDVDQICPRKVPMSWIKMQGGDTAKLVFIQDKLQITCQKLVVDLKSGKFLEALPEFDHGERPMITPCDEAVVPKSTRKRKHVQAYVSPNEMANIDAQSGTFMETPLVGLMAILAFFTG